MARRYKKRGLIDYTSQTITNQIPYTRTIRNTVDFVRKRRYEPRRFHTHDRYDESFDNRNQPTPTITKRVLKRNIRKAVTHGLNNFLPTYREISKVSRQFKRLRCMQAKDARRHQHFKSKHTGSSNNRPIRRHKKCQ